VTPLGTVESFSLAALVHSHSRTPGKTLNACADVLVTRPYPSNESDTGKTLRKWADVFTRPYPSSVFLSLSLSSVTMSMLLVQLSMMEKNTVNL
jgi:hypothetical protein